MDSIRKETDLTHQSGNVSITQEGQTLNCRMSLDAGRTFYNDFLTSPKVEAIIQDGPEELRNLYGELKSQWESVVSTEARSGAATS